MWHQIPLLHLLGKTVRSQSNESEQPRYTNCEYTQLREMLERLREEHLALQIERDRLRIELQAAIAGNAKVIYALDRAIQWAEALFAYLPSGIVLPEGVKTAQGALKEALRNIRR